MKVAVCVSGLCGGTVAKNIESHKAHFPYDYFFGTWADRACDIEDKLPGVPYVSIPEPKMHYHPIMDAVADPQNGLLCAFIAQKKRDSADRNSRPFIKGRHRTKQHLAHAHMLSLLPPEYDMVIRTRFDTRLSPAVDFGPYLHRSYKERRAICFGSPLGREWRGDRENYSFNKLQPAMGAPPFYMTDFLIMHPRDLFDVGAVLKLHEEKRLLAAEVGWWQILSMPYGGNHINMIGGASLERFERYDA